MLFVGPLYNSLITKKWKWNRAAHLFCDSPESLEELHSFAKSIGLKRSWFQYKSGSMPHYDITNSKRRLTIRKGVTQVDQRTEVSYLRTWRKITRLSI